MIKVIKTIDACLENIKSDKKLYIISINYEKKDGIQILKSLSSLKEENPYKFYLFNDDMMIYGVKLDENEYFIQEILKEDFETFNEEVMFIDNKEITKVIGNSNEKKLHIRRGVNKNQEEKIQFMRLEV